MNTIDHIINSATVFYQDLQSDSNGRYRSWEYCYLGMTDEAMDKCLDECIDNN